MLRSQRAVFEPVARGAEKGDRVLVDFTGTIDGVEFPGGQAKDFTITLGEGRMLPEFEAALAGMKAGDTKSFPLTFPADYHGKDVAGKTAQFTLTVKEVAVPNVPPLDAEFAKAFGMKSGKVEDLRAEVEVEPEARAEAQAGGRAEGPGAEGPAREDDADAAEVARGLRVRAADAPDGREPAAAGNEARGHQAHAGPLPAAGGGPRRARA